MIDMQRIGWENSPSTNTPISAENLKKMEDNAETAINEANDRIANKHLLFNKPLFDSTGAGVTGDLTGNVADYNFYIIRIRKWNEGLEETTVIVSQLDTLQKFLFPSTNDSYKAYFSVKIRSDNKVDFQMGEIYGWPNTKNQIQIEQIWGI